MLKMKVHICLLFTVFVLTTFTDAQDVSNLLKDRRYVEKQIDCILDRGRCDAIGRRIRGLLPEAVNNQCRHCTPRETAQARQMISFMQQNYPHEWHLILRHYAAMRYYKN